MKISARNQLNGTICDVQIGAVNAIVKIDLGNQIITADITKASVEDLGLEVGKDAIAIIKASNVMFAAGNDPIKGISARNQLAGTITSVTEGAVNGHVKLKLSNGNTITGSITNSAIKDLDLAEGFAALAIVKSTDVMIGVE